MWEASVGVGCTLYATLRSISVFLISSKKDYKTLIFFNLLSFREYDPSVQFVIQILRASSASQPVRTPGRLAFETRNQKILSVFYNNPSLSRFKTNYFVTVIQSLTIVCVWHRNNGDDEV